MKNLLLLFVVLFSNLSYSQSKVDTIFLGNNKTILKKTKLFHPMFQEGPVQLASEYAEIENKIEFKFKDWNDTSYTTIYDDQSGSNGQITIAEVNISDDTMSNFTYTLSHFVDTVIVAAEKIGNLQLYIKSNGQKIYFCAAKIEELNNGILQKYLNKFVLDGFVFNHLNFPLISSKEIERRKSTTYVLSELYYIKNKTTYYLDRQYIILAK